MKKLPLSLLTIFILTLTACGSAQPGAGSAPQSRDNAGALPATTQLIIGTIKLEGTAQAVTAAQARELLPLWQTLLVLSNSDTAANQEKEALIAQIQETMTAEQTQAIAAMNLTQKDMASIMQQQGTAMNGSQNSGTRNGNSSRNNGEAFGPGGGGPPGGMPGGGMPGGGGGGGFGGQGQNMSEDQIATAQAARQANANVVPPMLINAVIQYLQGKAGS